MGLAVDAQDNVYVADTCNNRIQKFTSEGEFLDTFGSIGAGEGQFLWPYDIAVDREGYIYVADSGNCRIQKFTTKVFSSAVGLQSSLEGQLMYPHGLDLDAEGNVYVGDYLNHESSNSPATAHSLRSGATAAQVMGNSAPPKASLSTRRQRVRG